MNNRNRFFFFLLAWLMPLAMTAQTNHWPPQTSGYEDYMSLTGVIQINGVEQQGTTLEVGAFCGMECRASAKAVLFPVTGRYLVFLTIYGNIGDQVTFKLYDHSQGMERNLQSPAAVTVGTNGLGSVTDPYVLNFTEPNYTITASASPSNGGTVSGGGTYQNGSSCTLTATPATGYSFVRWTKNGSQVSTNASYSFTVTENASYVAVFSLNSYTISASANPSNGGSVSGGGSYNYGSSCTLTATPATGYSFVRWTKNGSQVSTNASFSFTVTESATYVAVFSLNSYTISASANPSNGGSVSGAGSYNYGSSCTLTATPATGYSFVRWTKNGSQVSTNPSYTFTVTANASYVAVFDEEIEDYIVFADPNVKAVCIANWDTNGSGELSYAEAAAVTSLGQVFRQNTNITAFNEMQYFISLSSIGVQDFYGCSNLISIIIPNSVGSISTTAFQFCSSLTSITIPYSVVSISGHTFYGCHALEQIVVEEGNTKYDSRDNCNAIVETNSNLLVRGCKNTIIPSTINSIGYSAFSTVLGLDTISLGHVSSIGTAAFYCCFDLSSITVLSETPPALGSDAFGYVPKDIPVYVPCSSIEAYQNTESWNEFTNYQCLIHEYVDLGLPSGTLWATCNIGAYTPEEYGDYFAWGETQPKDNYDWSTYQYCNGNYNTLTKYCNNSNYGYNGFTDNLTTLLPEDDAATANWGEDWRMPTKEEWQELYNNTTMTWTQQNGVSGRLFTASNGNSLFLPGAGFRWSGDLYVAGSDGHYWSRSLDNGYSNLAWRFYFCSDYCHVDYGDRCNGSSVRAVRNIFQVTTTASPAEGGEVSGGGTYEEGTECTLTATPAEGYTFINWTENGEVVSTEATYSFTVTRDRALVANFEMEDYIVFADPNVKAICIANWDTNGSGELSYAEAAAVTSLGQVFRGDSEITSFEELQYFTGLTSISYYAFNNCSALTGNLIIPNSVTSIGNFAFYGCSGFTGTLTIPNSVTLIGDRAFQGCSGFTGSLTIPNSVTSIGSYAFFDCSGFTGSLTIPNSVTSIGNYAFYACYGFTGSLIIPNSLTIINSGVFDRCSGFNGFLSIPNTITSIGSSAFYYCSGFSGSLTIPNSVTSIGDMAFQGCSGFTGSLTIPNSITSIGNQVFLGCSGFTGSLTIPNSVTSIGSYAFRDCSGFTGSLTIPNSVTSLGYAAFYYCRGFTSMNILPETPPTLGSGVFNGVPKSIPVIVPCASIISYQLAEGWSEFTNYQGLDCPDYANISATADPMEGGMVNGMGVYDSGTTCTMTAMPNAGYTFMYWTENGNLVSSDAVYSFTINADRNLVAHFSLPLTINATANPTEGGMVEGMGEYVYNTTCTLTATPNEGYSFIKWTKNGETISYLSPYSITVTEDAEYVAHFEETLGTNVGTPEAANEYLPSYSWYNYTLSQQIYTPDEIGATGFVSTIGYFNAGATKTRNYDIYMVNTDKTVFENNTDWITVTEADRVFSGDVTMESGCWTTVVLDIPFAYDGTSNLAVIVDDNSGNYTYSPHMACRTFNANGNQAIRVYSDGTNYNPYNPSGYNGTLHSEKNQVVFSFLPSCHFITSGTWGNAANWSGGVLPGINDAVSIDANCALNKDAEVALLAITSGKTLTIRSGKTLTVTGTLANKAVTGLVIKEGAQLINASDKVAATMEKGISAHDGASTGWYTIASPMNGMEIAGSDFVTPEYDLYRFNETNLTFEEWENYKSNHADFTTFEKGRGYLYANSNDFTSKFTGILNGTSVTCSLTCTNRPNDPLSGFNLIGNPFPHEIYKGAGGAIDNANLASGYYTLDDDGTWQVHSFDDAILPGQGVLVKATAPTALTIAKSNEEAFAESGEAKRGMRRLCISVIGDNGQDRAYLYFGEGIGLDKVKAITKDAPNLAVRNGNGDFAIAHCDKKSEALELVFTTPTDGAFTLNVDVAVGDFEYLRLIDSTTVEEIDLLALLQNQGLANYTFQTSEQAGERIFKFVYKQSEM